MTHCTVAYTDISSSEEAGLDLGKKIQTKMNGKIPNVIILFASSSYDYKSLLAAINKTCKPEILVGSSSAGEFTTSNFGTDSACGVAIYSDVMKFSAGLGKGIKQNRAEACNNLLSALSGVGKYEYQYHSALILADALSGFTDEIIDVLTEKTLGSYQFFGGGAGDNARFQETHVFLGEEAFPDSAVVLEILSNKPLGLGVQHGWMPSANKMRVTASEGMLLQGLNGMSAVEAFTEYAEVTNQVFDPNNPIPFFLHNILGIELDGRYKLRVPLGVNADGSILCASDIPIGATICFMSIEGEAATQAAYEATKTALQNLDGNKPCVALFFDCVATRLRMGKDFDFELDLVRKTLGDVQYAGCNTYGQVARVEGQFSGFHNCTAVVCIIPE